MEPTVTAPSLESQASIGITCPYYPYVYTLEQLMTLHPNGFNYEQLLLLKANGYSDAQLLFLQNYPLINQNTTTPKRTHKKWSKERIDEEMLTIYGPDRYRYHNLPEQIISKSKFMVECLTCGYIWETSPHGFITSKHGCWQCATGVWTPKKFLTVTKNLFNDRHSYPGIENIEFRGEDTIINIQCNSCYWCWTTSIQNHINNKTSCPICGRCGRYTLPIFLAKARVVHGDECDYSKVREEHIKNYCSRIPIICNICKHEWKPTIHNHISNKTSCPKCYGSAPYTCESLILKIKAIYNEDYDLSQIKTEDIKNTQSKITVVHSRCGAKTTLPICYFIYSKRRCQTCNLSAGELECLRVLKELGIEEPELQFSYDDLPTLRYDFRFVYKNVLYILEFDGRQHFERIDYFGKTEMDFIMGRARDIVKTKHTVKRNEKIIRIDYTQIKAIKVHLLKAFESNCLAYFSTPEMYKWIIDQLECNEDCA